MRKILLSAALAAICTMGMTAMASETTLEKGDYIAGANNYQSAGTIGAKTIIIYKGNSNATIKGEDIFYIDQAEADTGFVGDVLALMKSGATEGTYTVAVDGGKSTTFEISKGDVAVEGCTPTTRTAPEKLVEEYGDDYCSVAFTIEGITLDELKSFKQVKSLVRVAEGAVGEDWVSSANISEVIEWNKVSDNLVPNTENSTVKCAVQVDWVPTTQADRFEIYLSTEAA